MSSTRSCRPVNLGDEYAVETADDDDDAGLALYDNASLQIDSFHSEAAVVADTDPPDGDGNGNDEFHVDGEYDPDDDVDEEDDAGLPFPGFAPIAFYYFDQSKQPRRWCLQLITWPYPLIFFNQLLDGSTMKLSTQVVRRLFKVNV